MSPEFARPERVEMIGEVERNVTIAAEPAERAALARRFGLLSIERLEATFSLRRAGERIEARGRVVADLTQPCAATGAPLVARADEHVELRFAEETAGDAERELDEADLDTLPIENGAIDLGEAAAETMALAIDPYARLPEADTALRAAGVLTEDEAGPFAGLASLKGRLTG
jgi:uncharacterized metal-binding protein YceD (DUF177 family)